MKDTEVLIKSFEEYEARRLTVKRVEMMRKGQRRGLKSRNRSRDIERAFKEKNKS
jgi:hypothetical protein